jgi:hypothetical protein
MKKYIYTSMLFCFALYAMIQATDNNTSKVVIKKTPSILGTSVNTKDDDFAAGTETPHDQKEIKKYDTLLITSNTNKRERVYQVPLSLIDSMGQVKTERIVLHDMPEEFVRHSGTVTPGAFSLVFASSAAIDSTVASFLGASGSKVQGGSDLFENFDKKIRNLSELNSTAWDAHPTIGIHEASGMELLVFSSDRMSPEGFSAPYENAMYTVNGIERKGNADLFISFRKIGKGTEWSKPINLRLFQGDGLINSPANEYSPFLYCIDGNPHLIFSSNRSGNYEIYYSTLQVSWDSLSNNGNLSMIIDSTFTLGNSEDSVNTVAMEMFPYIKYPHMDTTDVQPVEREMFFSSNRLSITSPDTAKKYGYGGLDLYKTKATFFCGIKKPEPCLPCQPCDPNYPCEQPPKPCPVAYNVTLINDNGNDTSVKNGVLEVYIDGKMKEIKGNTFTLNISSDSMKNYQQGIAIKAMGYSSLNTKPCKNLEPILTNYNGYEISRTIEQILSKSRKEQYDSMVQDKSVKAARTARVYDTLPKDNFNIPQLRKKLNERIDITPDMRIRVGRDTTIYIDSMPPLRQARFTRSVAYKDTVYTYDTVGIASSVRHIGSSKTKFSELRLPYIMVKATDSCMPIIVHDTIRLYPQYDKSPCCLELDTLLVFGSQKNVPYFQTAFWEVNTVKGYSEHIDRLRDGDLENASWIELNWKNKYWGNRNGNESTERMNMRRADYRAKAAIIDRNIKNMADSTSKVLKNFWKIYDKNDTAKVLITMTAYSDIRPITVGKFISPNNVQYISCAFDTVNYTFKKPTAIQIASGASLVGQDNDTLSKLRAYYGFEAVMQQLKKDSLFSELQRKGLIISPTEFTNPLDYERKLKQARIIVMAEGQYVDTSIQPEIQKYIRGENSYYDLDGVRRVDVTVRLINMRPDLYAFPDCCVKCK